MTATQSSGTQPSSLAIRAMPGLFVFLWSTGFIGAKYGLPYVEPFTFLSVRFAIVTAILLPVALVLRAPWPRRPGQVAHVAVVGLLVHAAYLGGVFPPSTAACRRAWRRSSWRCSPWSQPSWLGRFWATG